MSPVDKVADGPECGTLAWSKVDLSTISGDRPARLSNLVNGQWLQSEKTMDLPDPMTGEAFIQLPDMQPHEIAPFVESLNAVPKSGQHNPLKHPERYVMWGAITARAAAEMRRPEVEAHFARLIQRVMPKSHAQAVGEVRVTRTFLENFSGDQVRFLARGFSVPGDHPGQASHGYRWPFGPVAIITPFNFPLEIPALQMMGALYMGNKPLVHSDYRVGLVLEEFVRLLHHCGMELTEVDICCGRGHIINQIIKDAKCRSTLFTGSKRVAEKLAESLHGRVFLEDAGFDWKILGPDVQDFDYVAWQCDQDAYACSGQKCSAQSILFMHDAWAEAGLEEALALQASTRSLDNLTLGRVLTWTTEQMLAHKGRLLSIPGARLLFGGEALQGHRIPRQYGAMQPTAVFVPLREMLKEEHFQAVTTELFGPFQVVTRFSDAELPLVLEACERMEAHLSAAVVSNDIRFTQRVLGATVNGTTYAGLHARTTGAPQNHWFGPAGDPRAAGIGTPEAIRLVWSTHREIIEDFGPVPDGLTLMQS